jgi:hypothetical protein
MSLIESQKDMVGLLPFSDDCGADLGRYSWSQGDAEVLVRVPLPPGTTAKALDVKITTLALFIGLKAAAPSPVLAGRLFKPIKAEESMWTIEDRAVLVVTLTKSNRQYEEWWPHVVEGEPQCDFKTLKPPSKHLREMDQGAQAQIHKMMFDQEQKRKGMPTSDEQLMRDAMARAGPPPCS